jgi:hypothetical protein
MAKKETGSKQRVPEPVISIPISNDNEIKAETGEGNEVALEPKEISPARPPEPATPAAPVIQKEPTEIPYTTEGEIVAFLKNRKAGGYIPINDFLKSLFPLAKMNEPKAWQNQHAMKTLKNTLEAMVKGGQIIIEGNFHQRLGKHHYPDTTTMVTHYYNLDTLPLKAKLA